MANGGINPPLQEVRRVEKRPQGDHLIRPDCRYRVPGFLLRSHREVHGRHPEDLLPAHFVRVQRVRSVWDLFLCESAIRFHPGSEIGLAGGFRGGSRVGVYFRGAHYRTDLGASGVGNLLGLLYVSYLLLRSMIEEPDKRALFSALFGIFAFLDVPLVYFSIRWWRTQHPQPVILGGPGSGLEPRMRVSYLLMWGALTGVLILLVSARYRLEALRASVEDLRREAEVR